MNSSDDSVLAQTQNAQSRAHTPGPWTATFNKRTEYFTVLSAKNRHVTTVYMTDDARLIAAAPCLLEALLEATTYMASQSGGPDFDQRDAATLRKCGNAIAKATGAA